MRLSSRWTVATAATTWVDCIVVFGIVLIVVGRGVVNAGLAYKTRTWDDDDNNNSKIINVTVWFYRFYMNKLKEMKIDAR